MFAFWFNTVFAVIYTVAAFKHPDTQTFIVWTGGFHAGLALALAILWLHSKREG